MNKKVKLAVISAHGLDKGGTEKFLQTVAANLPKDKYIVDYYYINSDAQRVSEVKKNLLKDSGVNLYPYEAKNVYVKYRYGKQEESTFFDVYKGNCDLILTGSCGVPEEPLTKIKNVPILQSIHYVSGVDNQFNLSRVLHISEFSKNMWLEKGGDGSRVCMISHPIEIPEYNKIDIRKQFGIPETSFVYGLHQRDNDFIFSDMPLAAYKQIETEQTAFIVCGGSKKYREQAEELGLKNCFFISATDSVDTIYSFLNSIDVYAHGRYDGELNSTALAEAMYFGLPIVSHPSNVYNGHLEVIKENGFVTDSIEEYAEYLKLLKDNHEVFIKCCDEAKNMFYKKYDLQNQMNHLMDIFSDVLEDPYPNYWKRKIKGIKTDIANMLKLILIKFTK